MLKKLMLLLCLGAFVVAIGCGKPKPEEPKDGEKPPVEEDGEK